MRLIDVEVFHQQDGRLCVTDSHVSSSKPYAILSHTWQRDEVRFKDLEGDSSTLKGKLGYVKISHACRQAKKNGLSYLWVDTCCIDVSSSAELSEAINSMYKYYGEAQVCFVYLADMPGDCPRLKESITKVCHEFNGVHIVHGGERDSITGLGWANADHWLSTLAECRWWKRGWTLQELIAPKKVAFYGASWNPIAFKHDLLYSISRITGIDTLVLSHECLLSELSVAKKLSWAAQRRTTRKEDEAYCLLGILDINMPSLYGEGEKAFLRLQEAVILRTRDASLFLWSRLRGQDLLAPSPASFMACNRIVYDTHTPMQLSWDMTHRGLKMNIPLISITSEEKEEFLGILPCYLADDFSHRMAIHLRLEREANMLGEAVYSIQPCRPICTNARLLNISNQVHIVKTEKVIEHAPEYISVLIPRNNFRRVSNFSALQTTSSIWVKQCPPDCRLDQTYPEHQWNISPLIWNRYKSLAREVCGRTAGVSLRSGAARIFVCIDVYREKGIVFLHLADEDDTLSSICEEINNRCHEHYRAASSSEKSFRKSKDTTDQKTFTIQATMTRELISAEYVWVVSITCTGE